MSDETRYSITQAAELLDRVPHTLRSWEYNDSMPKELRPPRDERGHRYWTPELIEQIKDWMVANDFHPGRGIAYKPDNARLHEHITRIRQSAAGRTTAAGALRLMITQAHQEMHLAPADIVANLPKVAERVGVPLDVALRTAAEVLPAA